MKTLNTMYFSPTGTTKTIIDEISNHILEKQFIKKGIMVDFTLPNSREEVQIFGKDDILLIGLPVYAGRAPNVLLDYLNSIKGENTLAIPVVLYGNRDYDDALIELSDILGKNGFKIIGAASFIGEHSFSKTLAKDRPDRGDLEISLGFADKIYEKIRGKNDTEVKVKGNINYKTYYIPKDEKGRSVDIRKVTPKTDENCIDCKICAEVCPMGSIDYEDVAKLNGICIKCGACIKKCPTSSKYFDDPDYLRHKKELEDGLKLRKEPEIFI